MPTGRSSLLFHERQRRPLCTVVSPAQSDLFWTRRHGLCPDVAQRSGRAVHWRPLTARGCWAAASQRAIGRRSNPSMSASFADLCEIRGVAKLTKCRSHLGGWSEAAKELELGFARDRSHAVKKEIGRGKSHLRSSSLNSRRNGERQKRRIDQQDWTMGGSL